MPEARDRRERPVDYPAAFLNRRYHGILLDEPSPAHLNPFQSPVVQRLPSESTTMGRGGGVARGNLGVRRTGGGRVRRGLGVARRGRARASASSVLPSWYPRTPLRDVSSVVRAIERRRARMGDTETPTPQQLGVVDDSLLPLSGEHNYSTMVTPGPSVGFKRPWPPSTAKVHQILLDIARESSAEEALTPEKKLLNSIDKVEKVVMEEIQKMKSTPSAKRAEREKKVRTLMSMR